MAFPAEEYKERVRRACEAMPRHGLDGIVVSGDLTAALNYLYFTGHLPRDFQMQVGRPHIFVLNSSGDAAIITLNATASTAAADSWVTDIRQYAEPFAPNILIDTLKDLGLGAGRIGWELGPSQKMAVPVGAFLEAQRTLSSAQFLDATSLIEELRMIKSAAEIGAVKEASRINQAALEYAFSQVGEGATEAQACTEVMVGLVKNGADRPPVAQLLSTSSPKFRGGRGHDARFSGGSNEPLAKGDLIFLDSGCSVEGYWSEFNRTGSIGGPTDEQVEYNRIARLIVRQTVEDSVKPGITYKQMLQTFFDICEENKVPFASYKDFTDHPFRHLCHGMGITSSEPPYVRFDRDAPLEAGMVLSVEAYYATPEFKYANEEAVAVTENGFEWLSVPDDGIFTCGSGL